MRCRCCGLVVLFEEPTCNKDLTWCMVRAQQMASKKLGLDKAVLQTMTKKVSSRKNGTADEGKLSNEELATLLKEGAYHMFLDEEYVLP